MLKTVQGRAICAFALIAFSSLTTGLTQSQDQEPDQRKFIQVTAKDKYERTELATLGLSIEAVRSDSVWGFATPQVIAELKSKNQFKVLGVFPMSVSRGGHQSLFDFPSGDEKFHNYRETNAKLRLMTSLNADISRIHKIGNSLEGLDILAIQINTNPQALMTGKSNKPGVIFMGTHHAREHVSTEIPLMMAEFILKNRDDPKIAALIDNRDIWFIPMVNPDGVEWDISSTSYKYWRKNRRKNSNGTYGVDLNRNYGYKWGTGGSSKDPGDDTYMGEAPFSEPETQNIKKFVEDHLNAKILLSFHTYSELILYPWGGTYDPIANTKDLAVFEKMAKTMAGWNKYKPQQSSDLYIASGDTTDWAYGEHGIFAFTFELSPSQFGGGGFYPGASVIDKVFQDNIKPCLYMIELADDPYKSLDTHLSKGLKFLTAPGIN